MPSASASSSVTREEMKDVMEDLFEKYMSSCMGKVADMHLEVKKITHELEQVTNSMTHMNETFEAVMKDHKLLSEKVTNLEVQQINTNNIVTNLQSRINQLEQEARSRNLEIQCLPEKKSENLVSIVKDIANVININIKEDNIMRVTRVSKLNPNNARPRSVVVEFSSTRIRDNYLAASISFNKKNPENKLNLQHLGYTGTKSAIFVAEHLSPTNKSLHAATRQFAKEKNYKYVWVRGGRVYLRKNEESSYIIVKSTISLENLK
ncbi:hypothetical protein K1T71_001503 [Dendrolimus kikuchii]|uniref:Uncharacterized protein n=1 Tax=Dendrolimus kikuchii TaxID=765133 RepID=A0ACC1DI07_9NEOP|nr:hypothetical protein K1T71_001503 [Dendrolimus kikuchii]